MMNTTLAAPHVAANLTAKRTELLARLQEINDLGAAAALLNWDQTTYMPVGGAAARGRQLATLQRLAHEKFSDPTVGHLLDDLQPYADDLPYEADDAALLRLTRRFSTPWQSSVPRTM